MDNISPRVGEQTKSKNLPFYRIRLRAIKENPFGQSYDVNHSAAMGRELVSLVSGSFENRQSKEIHYSVGVSSAMMTAI